MGELELRDVLMIKTNDDPERQFEVVALVEGDGNNGYAVLYCETLDDFIVTDANGKLLDDPELAQEILDDFFAFAEEASPNGAAE